MQSNVTDNSDYNNLLVRAMEQANELAAIGARASESVGKLVHKRVTLEEKMLRAYLHELSAIAARVIASIHDITRGGASIDEHVLSELASLDSEMAEALQELLNAINYDLNFLEQYFEHGFYNKLINEYRFVERLLSIAKRLDTHQPAG